MTATDLTVEELLAVESIKNLRVLGARHLDPGRVDELAAVYTEDAVCGFGPYGTWEGRDMLGASLLPRYGAPDAAAR